MLTESKLMASPQPQLRVCSLGPAWFSRAISSDSEGELKERKRDQDRFVLCSAPSHAKDKHELQVSLSYPKPEGPCLINVKTADRRAFKLH